MQLPTLFECPSCGKQHYVVYCAAEDGGEECGEPFIYIFFPSRKDALCPRHRYADDAARRQADEARRFLCPMTGRAVSIDEAMKGLATAGKTTTGGLRRRDSGVVEFNAADFGPAAPAPAPAPERPPTPRPPPRRRTAELEAPRSTIEALERELEGTEDDEAATGTGSEIVKCRKCFVLFDRQRTPECPRCGTPWEEGHDQEPVVVVRKRKPSRLEAAFDPDNVSRFVLLHGVKIAVPFGILALGLAVAIFMAASVPTQLGLTGALLLEVVILAWLGTAFVRGRRDRRLMEWLEEERERRAQGITEEEPDEVAEGEAGPVPARPAFAEVAASRTRTTAARGRAVRMPVHPTQLGKVRYLKGYPGVDRRERGALWAGPTGIQFHGPKSVLEMPPDEVLVIQQAGSRIRPGWVVTVGLLAFLYLRFPARPPVRDVPEWAAGWATSLIQWLSYGYAAAIVLTVAIVLCLLVGLWRARHHRLVVRIKREEEHHDVRFATSLASLLRTRRFLRVD